MSGEHGTGAARPRAESSWAGRLARAALVLYPAAWRARYGDEVRVLLEDSGADLRTVASLVGQAVPAWIWPMRHLYDRPARMRASLATVLMAWTVLLGLAVVFAQITQDRSPLAGQLTGVRGHVIVLSYGVFAAAIGVSVLAVGVGGLPLWLLMVRRARREQRHRDLASLLAPVVVPVLYLAAGAATSGLVTQPGLGNGPASLAAYCALVALGFAAGLMSAAGPALALRRLRPRGPAVGLAARAAGVAAAAMTLAGAASIVAAVGLYRWASPYHHGWQLAVFPPLVLLVVTVAVVSAARGLRAARSPAPA
jgi:hypothetical protein